MTLQQYINLTKTLVAPIFGQFLGMVSVTGKDFFRAAAYREGWRVVTKWNVRIAKFAYIHYVNTSTGAVASGTTFAPVRASNYNDEGLNGFFRHLISDPEKKYIGITYDADKTSAPVVRYFDPQGKEVTLEEAAPHVQPAKLEKTLSDRQQAMADANIDVKHFDIGIANVALLKVAGLSVIDPALQQYLS